MYSLKEVSTCQYEVIILAPALCGHPNFKPQETAENTIRCSPQGFAPVHPKVSWTQVHKNHLVKVDLEVNLCRKNYIFLLFLLSFVYCLFLFLLFCRI